MNGPQEQPPEGRLAANILHFCRALRAAGLPVGPGQVLGALEAVRTVGLGSRTDFYWALHAALINRRDQQEVFDQAFHLFWRNPEMLKRAMQMMLPQVATGPSAEEDQVSRRVADAMRQHRPGQAAGEDQDRPDLEVDATLTFSDREVLSSRDFEQMTAAELATAKRLIARLRLPLHDRPTRRFRADPRGPRVDLRRTLRASLRQGGAIIPLARQRRRTRPPPLVVLCDISGSMSQYSRMLLHFLHAVTSDRDRVYSFVFGTRLTNITRHLRHRDIDLALAGVGEAVQDWSGGTRIGHCLHEFNRDWSRRVLAQGAIVLLITDGLDRDSGQQVAAEMDRLHRSCRRLVWLNPLLRYDAYAPKTLGARAMIDHVDELRPVHSIDSLEGLIAALQPGPAAGRSRMAHWRLLATGGVAA